MLAGEAGIGKTRLSQELIQHARRRGATVVSGAFTEDRLSPPFLAFVQALDPITRGRTAEQLELWLEGRGAVLTTLFPHMAHALGARFLPDDASQSERYVLFEALYTLLAALANESALVLVLEDLQWADRPSLVLLQHLARRLQQSGVLILGICRDEDRDLDDPLSRTLAHLARDRLSRTVRLAGLGEEDVAAMVAGIAGWQPPERFVRALHRQTEGNPLFVEEIVRHVFDRNVLDAGGNWPGDSDLAESELPTGVKEVISARLARLTPNGHILLRQGAIIGQEFELEVLQHVSGVEEDALLTALEEGLDLHVIREQQRSGRLTYDFTHALTRQVLLQELSLARRQRLHRQVGAAIEHLYGTNLETRLPELAYHFCRAAPGADLDKAVGYAKRAADRAMAQLAYEEGARLYRMALEVADLKDPPDSLEACDLLLALGEAQNAAGEVEEARATFLRGAELARRQSLPESLGRAALGFGAPYSVPGRVDQVQIQLLEEALAALPEEDTSLRARVLTRLAGAVYFEGSRHRSARLGNLAMDMARRLGDKAALAAALHAWHWNLAGAGARLEERLPVASEIVRLSEEVGAREILLLGYSRRITDFLEMGDMAAADADIAASVALARALRKPSHLWLTSLLLAMRTLMSGRLDDAQRLAQEALATGQTMQVPDAFPNFAMQNFLVLKERGTLQAIEAAVKNFAEQNSTMPTWRCALAFVYSEIDRREETRREFEYLAENNFSRLAQDATWAVSLTLLSEVCCFLGDRRCARRLYDLLLPYAERNVVIGAGIVFLGSASRSLGLLATSLGRCEEAEKHFQDALTMNTRTGAAPWTAWTQYGYARALLARHARGDRRLAFDLLSQARVIAEELGMPRLLGQIRQILDSRLPAPPARLSGLTMREIDILRQIAAGRSNREISEELALSVRTVERHIANVYSKINVHSRTQAVRYALDEGLAGSPAGETA